MGLEMDRMQRLFVGVVMPLLLVGATFVPMLVLRTDLPSPIAIHFNGDGVADGSAPVQVHLLVTALFTVASSAVLVSVARKPEAGRAAGAAIATFVGSLLAWLNVLLLLANRGEGRWQDATLGSGAVWGAVFSSLGVAMAVAHMERRHVTAAVDPAATGMELGPDERAAWFGRARSQPFAVGALLSVFIGVVVLMSFAGGGLPTGLTLLFVGLAMQSFTTVHVAVGASGVSVRGGLPWPRIRLELADVEAARAIDLDPMRSNGLWIGWGYRGSLRLFGTALWVVRKGDALELDLAGGRNFTVTVDDAPEAAAVVNGLLAHRPGAV